MNEAMALIPAFSHVNWRLADALRRARMPCMHVHGCSDLVRARSRLLCDGLKTRADVFLFIDADIVASPEQLLELAQSSLVDEDNSVSGCYLSRPGHLAGIPSDPDASIVIGGEKRYVQALVAGMGFAAVHRASIERIQVSEPVVRDFAGDQWTPFFLPFILQHEQPNGNPIKEYVSEDYAFWWRLKMAGKTQLWLDTHLAVGHIKENILLPAGEISAPAERAEG